MAAAAGAALGDLNPKQKPNPTGVPPPGNLFPRFGDLRKENAKLIQLLAQKTKVIEISSIEMNKCRSALHASRQQNMNLALANSQITAELNQAKDRLKVLQHELACATAVLKFKGSGLELQRKSSTADHQLKEEVTAQEEVNADPLERAPVEAHQADSVETQPSIPCNTVLEEALLAKTNKRTSVSMRTSKRKSESDMQPSTKDNNTVRPSYKPDMQPPESSHHEDQRNVLRRRSSRLNPNHSPETQSSPQYNVKHPDPTQKRANKRVASKRKLESCEGQKDSNIEEDTTAKLHSTSREPPPHHGEIRKSQRQKLSSISNQVSCEVAEGTLEAAQVEDLVASLPPSSSKISIEQSKTEKQNLRRSSAPEDQEAGRRSSVEVTGRRSSMRGAAKAVSYKEIPLNVKMRRP